MWTDSRADIENAFVDAGPVEDILGPTVAGSGNDAEHVLHAQRDPSPMMRFHFRHGYDEIGRKDSARQPQLAEAGIVRLELRFDEVVAIQIDELDLAMQHLIGETGFVHQQFGIAMMAGAFGDSYRTGFKPEEALASSADELRVRVYRPSRDVLDDIGLE